MVAQINSHCHSDGTSRQRKHTATTSIASVAGIKYCEGISLSCPPQTKQTEAGFCPASPWLWVAALVGVGLAALALLSSRRKPVADQQHRRDKPGVRVGSSV